MRNNNILIDHNINLKLIKKDLEKIFYSNSFTQGKYNNLFSNTLKKYLKVKSAYLTSSATTALSICLEVLNIKKNDEVVISDFSWISTAHVVENIGAKPVFADVNKDTFNMCPKNLRKKITKKTKAIIFVHAFGNPSGYDEIYKIAKEKKIPLIHDAACSLGSKNKKKFIGNSQDLTCFSFHQRKILTTGEGGAIVTNNKSYAKKIDLLLKLGSTKHKNKKYLDFISTGYNYRLSEIQCLLGLKQIKNLEKKIKFRNYIHKKYIKKLSHLKFVPQVIEKNFRSNIQSCVFKMPKKITLEKMMNYLSKNNIDCTIGTYSLSNTEFYKKKYKQKLPNSNNLFKSCISLPCHPKISFEKIVSLIEKLIIKNNII